MKSYTEPRFWKFYDRLPPDVQKRANEAYLLWKTNPYHPSFQFKRVDDQDPIYSVRIGRGYRALGWLEDEAIIWYWIGNHDDYDRLLR
jgi:hypothetical protein